MQDATARNQPPSLFFGIKPKRKTLVYTELDVTLADALRMYEDSLCRDCGSPALWAWDPKLERYYQLDPDAPHCSVCGLLNNPEREKPEPGDKTAVKNTLFD